MNISINNQSLTIPETKELLAIELTDTHGCKYTIYLESGDFIERFKRSFEHKKVIDPSSKEALFLP